MADAGDNIQQIDSLPIEEEMTDSFMQFALSVIVARALPDVRDGLKPSQRRILVAMNDMNLGPTVQHRKCAGICGETQSKYHPHGSEIIYPTLARMAQDFNARYPLVDPHGNFGSIDGDPPGAMRYTEARLARPAVELLDELKYKTVDVQPNYDESIEEPNYLPARFPNLMVNGTGGIAVGMATNIPPHNLGETIDGCIALLDDSKMEPTDLMKYIKGPDFPTAGMILGSKGVKDYFETGRGSVVMQGRATIEPIGRDRFAIIVTEVPFQVAKASLIEQISKLHNEKKIDGLSAVRDETDRKGMRLVIELRRDANPNVVLNQIYKRTMLRTTFSANMLALVPIGGTLVPRRCTVKDLLQHYLDHRYEVIKRRTRFLLRQAEERAHIVEGLLKAIDNIDALIALIRASNNRTEAREGLMKKWEFSERQANAILDMQLGQLTRLSHDELTKEYEKLQAAITDYREILASRERQTEIIKTELREVKRKHADERRTQIIPGEADDISVEDLIAQDDMCVTITRDGYIKRLPVSTYRTQRRGGRGVLALSKKEEDSIQDIFVATTHHLILFFTDQGRIYRLKAYQIPMASRQAKGMPIVNLLPLEARERVTAWIPVESFDTGGYLFMVTTGGYLKKTELKAYDTPLKAKGLNAIRLEEGDSLNWVLWTNGEQDIVCATQQGKAIRFTEQSVRSMGRTARGVKGPKLQKGDKMVSAEAVGADDPRDLLVVCEKGLGKRTPLSEYRKIGRTSQGVLTVQVTDRTGPVLDVEVVDDDDQIMCITAQGIAIRMPVKNIRQTGRVAQGVKVVNLDEKDAVRAVAKVIQTDAGTDDDE
ncbi:MAG TPA: DNA gyrase subunit A [Armatimonadota bacterium]|nr:DNA gyrase subunit A [Armatimonadota bacterium]